MKSNRIYAKVVRRSVHMALWIIIAAVAAWSAKIGPDAYGYMANDSTPYSFVDISSTGTAVLAGADDDKAVVNIGFPFLFYTGSYTSVCISSNGLLTFDGCNADFANQDLSATKPLGNNPTIAPFWFDLTFAAKGAGAIYYQTLGTALNRQFVVQWQNAFPLNGAKGITFQAILYEADGKILFQYLDVNTGAGSPVGFGGGATVGIRDRDGQSNGHCLQWSYKVPVLHNEEAIFFVRSDTEGPVIAGMPAPTCEIWPANHKMVQVATVVASDPASGLASFTVTGTSNEPPAKGEEDILITGSGNKYLIQLRAERDAHGTGRIYTLVATAQDRAGNTSTSTSKCTVPHDQGKK